MLLSFLQLMDGRHLSRQSDFPSSFSMKLPTILFSFFATAAASQATIVGFGNLGGNNTTVPAGLASNATAAGNGFVVTNGATPNITLTWDANWDIHTSNFFTELENQTAGGGAWDNEGSIPRIGQLDTNTHTIDFSAAPGFAVVLNSFDFANTPETTDTSTWSVVLTDSQSVTVWSQQITLANNDSDVLTVSPNFTGLNGAAYRLTFTQTTATPLGQHGIDNLSFNQVAIPEPSLISLAGLAGVGLGLRRRRK